MRMPHKPFGKEHTAMTKGILIILMLIHHALRTNDEFLIDIVAFCKICISGFAFLSAYGMTQNLKRRENWDINSYFKFICRRFIKFESFILFIYLLAILYKTCIRMESLASLYDFGNGFKAIYIFIDAIGMAVYFGTPQINITWWYCNYAILLIITIPFLYMLYQKFRYLLLPAICLLPLAVSSVSTWAGVQNNYVMLLPSVFMGIAFAYEEWFEQLKAYGGGKYKDFEIFRGFNWNTIGI